MNIFILTLRFLTRIPVPFKDSGELIPNKEFAKGVIYYPIVGLIVGLICCGIYYATSFALRWTIFSSICAVLAHIIVTGAFHLDGLADTCDGIFSSRKKDKMLEIMRDSRIGTNGAIAIVFDIILKIALFYMLDFQIVYIGILLAPVAAKMITPILFTSKYAREGEGLGNIYIGNVSEMRTVATVFLGAFIILIFLGTEGIIPIIVSLMTAVLFQKYMEHRIGGMTGDTLGAGAELTEIMFLIALVAERSHIN